MAFEDNIDPLTTAAGAPVADNQNSVTAGPRGPVFFFRDPLKFPDLARAVKRDPRTNLRDPENNWGFWTNLPEALHQVTIVMSDRGIPRSYRHMHGFGSHTFSLVNGTGERHWVKFHFRTRQGDRGPHGRTGGSPHRPGPRIPPARPLRRHRTRRLPEVDAARAGHARGRRRALPLPPVRPDNFGRWVEQPAFADPAQAVGGTADRFDFRQDDDN